MIIGFFFFFFLQMSNGRHAENFTPSCLVAWVYDNNKSAELLDSIHIPYSFKTSWRGFKPLADAFRLDLL